eukprot:CAMPEP_0182858048 /NCGR_PEP_ID=MMETSP0034_2-20130328/3432_1 /TAXON_ID=156128 /ORGANISM="Nephroselmis pyriformis, Strain CCMP717" /LENGTH=208 /DNA_ID=CAMNT_0024989389 /DNA_START=415 /DNA_END=1038 /DNA_ORIENTATION=+
MGDKPWTDVQAALDAALQAGEALKAAITAAQADPEGYSGVDEGSENSDMAVTAVELANRFAQMAKKVAGSPSLQDSVTGPGGGSGPSPSDTHEAVPPHNKNNAGGRKNGSEGEEEHSAMLNKASRARPANPRDSSPHSDRVETSTTVATAAGMLAAHQRGGSEPTSTSPPHANAPTVSSGEEGENGGGRGDGGTSGQAGGADVKQEVG